MRQIFQQYAAQGQSFFNASGDSGAYTGTIDYPADDTNIMVVGGTTLFTTGPGGAWSSEIVWSTFPSQADASSGGISPTNAIPAWQQGIDMTANQGSTVNRNIPDVALVADNLFLIANNGVTYYAGGTSAAAPLWAAFTALVNQQAVAGGNSTVGFLNPALYAIGKGANYNADFHDITTGNNTNSGSPNLFHAVPGYDLCTGWGTPTGGSLINRLAPLGPVLANAGAILTAETCTPTNGGVDPGETVTMSLALQNTGSADTTNLVATLLATGGVTSPGAPRAYGVLTPGGAAVSQPFSFTASGICGGTITATLQLQDGATNLGAVSFNIPLGVPTAPTNVTFSQNFDGVTAPSLPAGWTTTHSGSQAAWVTSTANRDTTPNAAFGSENRRAGLSELISPAIPVVLPTAQLSFRNFYNTQSGADGGVLEIQIGAGAYADILAAGGSFAGNGYNGTLGSGTSTINGRAAWTGNSGGFITTTVNLPAAAAGQNVHLKWRLGTDNSTSGSGWYVDTISVKDGSYTCCSGSPSIAITQTASTNPAVMGQNLTYTLVVTNQGSAAAATVTVTDTLPAGVTFVSASAGGTNNGGTVQVRFRPAGARRGNQPDPDGDADRDRVGHQQRRRDFIAAEFQPGQQFGQPGHDG